MIKYKLRDITKIILIGLANAGKTSIAKFINSLNIELALQTSPSTTIERIKKRILTNQMRIFVLPGQLRYANKNMEYLFNLLDNNTIIIYVIDANDHKLKKENYSYILNLLRVLTKYKKMKNIGTKIPLIFLAHKMDLPRAEDICNYLKPLEEILAQFETEFQFEYYNTSIYRPQTLINVLVSSVTPLMIQSSEIQSIANNILRYTRSKAISISDYNGFPLAYAGEQNLAFWISTIPIRLQEIIEHEIDIASKYNSPIAKLFVKRNPLGGYILYHEFSINSTRLVLFTLKDRESLSIAIVNPQINYEIIREILPKIAEKISEILLLRGNTKWS